MKKLFIFLALVGMITVGCTEDELEKDKNKDNGNQTEQPEENGGGDEDEDGIPENIFFEIDNESASFEPDGGSVDVVVYSNYKWEISGTSDWCTPSIKNGDTNEDGQKVTFTAKVAYDNREATFWFCCAEEKIKFTVSQKLKETIIPSNNNTFKISYKGDTVAINYQTTVECEVVIPEEAQSWISIANGTRALSSEQVVLTVSSNSTPSERTAVVRVEKVGDNTLFAEYTIIQQSGYGLFIEYTSSDGRVVAPNNNRAFDATIISNTYKNGVGIIEFDAPITSIGDEAFYWNNNLTSITIPDSVTSIGQQAFMSCRSLTSVTIGNSVTTIEQGAFCGCYSLTSVTIPDSVTKIGHSAFSDCKSLTSVIIGDNVTFMADWAFGHCSSLTNLIIGNVTNIGGAAFHSCSSLTSVTIPDSVTNIGGSAFYGCSSLTNLTIGKSVTSIGYQAFFDCDSLTNVVIPDSVTKIEGMAFHWCDGITNVVFGDNLTYIGEGAFDGCINLTSVTIPDNVTDIGWRAFANCSLTSVYCKPTTPPFLGGDTFLSNKSEYKIYVPTTSENEYKSARLWSYYSDIIVGYDF